MNKLNNKLELNQVLTKLQDLLLIHLLVESVDWEEENKIFVQIASYRDPQLVPTIQDMLKKAKYPNNLIFGICWQYDESEPVDMFDDNPNFRVAKYHYSESQGLGWARHITNTLYSGETYTLQIDSHHRFVQDW